MYWRAKSLPRCHEFLLFGGDFVLLPVYSRFDIHISAWIGSYLFFVCPKGMVFLHTKREDPGMMPYNKDRNNIEKWTLFSKQELQFTVESITT